MWRSLLRLPPVAFVWGVADTYSRLGVARAAAALAYFLILTLFPLLMCVNFFIGLLPLSPEEVFSALDSILPRESLSLILDYLDYVSAIPQSQSTPLLLACLFTIGLSASAGLRTLLQTMDELYQVRRANSLHRLVLSVALSLLFLLTIYLSIVVIFTGDWFFRLLESRLPPSPAGSDPPGHPVPAMGLAALSAAVPAGSGPGAGCLPAGDPPPLPPPHPHPVPHRPVVRHRPGGLLRAVLLVHRDVLPVLPGLRLPGLPDHSAGVALLLREHPAAGGGGRAGMGTAPAPLWRRLTAVHLLCYNRKNRPGGTVYRMERSASHETGHPH